MQTPRRSFLGRLAALLAAGAAPSTLSAATRAAEAAPGDAGGAWPDERWLEMLANREHRIIVETGVILDGLAIRRGMNFMDVMNQDYGIPDARIGLAIGFHSPGLAFILNDAMWAKYELGKRWGVNTAAGAPATANVYRAGAPYAIESLAARGAVFLACNRALRRLAGDLAGPGGNAQAVHQELVANVLPQATVVPAMIAALSRAQSRGVPYMAVA